MEGPTEMEGPQAPLGSQSLHSCSARVSGQNPNSPL